MDEIALDRSALMSAAAAWLPADSPTVEAEVLSFGPEPRLEVEGLDDALSRFGEHLDRVEEIGGVATRPATDAGGMRNRELRERMDALGYDDGRLDDRLAAFQRERGAPEGPFSASDARVLRHLLDPDATPSGAPEPVLRRARLARLRRYRLFKDEPRLQDYAARMEELRRALPGDLSLVEAERLCLDHGALLDHVAAHLDGHIRLREADGPWPRLVVGVVTVELWISGLVGEPDDQGEVGDLPEAIARARRLLGVDGKDDVLGPKLLRALADDRLDSPALPEGEAVEFLSQHADALAPIWGRVRRSFGRARDGMRRALGWLGRRAARLRKGLAAWLAEDEGGAVVAVINALRVVRATAGPLLRGTREALRKFAGALDDLMTGVEVRRRAGPDDPGRLVVALRFSGGGGDAAVFVAPDAQRTEIVIAAYRARRLPVAIELAGQVVSIVARALVAAAAAGVGAIVGLVCAIARHGPEIIDLMQRLAEPVALLED